MVGCVHQDSLTNVFNFSKMPFSLPRFIYLPMLKLMAGEFNLLAFDQFEILSPVLSDALTYDRNILLHKGYSMKYGKHNWSFPQQFSENVIYIYISLYIYNFTGEIIIIPIHCEIVLEVWNNM